MVTTWDEKAEDYARETGLSREAVMVAARWQRDQLRTDEAIERVARGIAQAHGLTPELWGQYERVARAAITALLDTPANPTGSVE